jgi:hypothetical protein
VRFPEETAMTDRLEIKFHPEPAFPAEALAEWPAAAIRRTPQISA